MPKIPARNEVFPEAVLAARDPPDLLTHIENILKCVSTRLLLVCCADSVQVSSL